jgi:hypothetical protein
MPILNDDILSKAPSIPKSSLDKERGCQHHNKQCIVNNSLVCIKYPGLILTNCRS